MNRFYKKALSLFIAVWLGFQPLAAGTLPYYGDMAVQEVVKVHDGDTFRVHLADLHPLIGHNIPIRIAGIDTPELCSKDPELRALAIRAKEFTIAALAGAKEIILVNMQRDKYFRILADVYVDGCNLGEALIAEGLAKPYDGKAKSWSCTTKSY